MSDDNKNPGLSFELILLLAVGFVGALFWKAAGAKILLWWHLHKTQVLGVGAVAMAAYIARLGLKAWNWYVEKDYERAIIAANSSSVFLGVTKKGERVNLPYSVRICHLHLLGATGSGKTKSVILPLALGDIERGSGLIIIDGKGDSSFLETLYSYTVRCNRASEFRLFSLTHIARSSTFNPLIGGTPKQIAERVFSALTFESDYYRKLQYTIFEALLSMVMEQKGVPTFILMHQLLTDVDLLETWLESCEDHLVKGELSRFAAQSEEKRLENTSGLASQLSQLVSGDTAKLFNVSSPGIDIEEAVSKGQICYFQIPTMYYPFLAQLTGKLVLQTLSTIITMRHAKLMDKSRFFTCILDDFQDYMYPEFAAHLNKSREANFGVVLSHQALGDLDKVAKGFKDIVCTNATIKIVMRLNEPVSVDYLAKYFGTKTTRKITERQTKGMLGDHNTGEGSVREVEQYIHHPNEIKQLHTGQAIMSFPHLKGTKVMKINFVRREEIPVVPYPETQKPKLDIEALLRTPHGTQKSSKLTKT